MANAGDGSASTPAGPVGEGHVGLSATELGGSLADQPEPVLRESPDPRRDRGHRDEVRTRPVPVRRHVPDPRSFDWLTFIPCTLSRVPLEATASAARPRRSWARGRRTRSAWTSR